MEKDYNGRVTVRRLLPSSRRITSSAPSELRALERRLKGKDLKTWAGVLLGSAPETWFEDRSPDDAAKFVEETFAVFRSRHRRDDKNILISGKVLYVHQDDRPFIVRSLREFLRQNSVGINVLLHPLVAARRDKTGKLISFEGEARESFIAIELTDDPPPGLREKVGALMGNLDRIVEDFDEMNARLSEARALLETYRGLVPDEEHEESSAFFEWLQNGNFVLLGFREYAVARRKYELVHKSGLGLLRNEDRSRFRRPVPVRELDDEMREDLLRGPLLTLSKSHTMTSIYRGGRMDFIVLKRVDARGRVIGTMRFLGLISDRANYGSKIDLPILRKKYARIREAFRAVKGSFEDREIAHLFSGQQIDTLLLTDTRDLVREFQLTIRGYAADEVRVATRYDPVRHGLAMTLVMPQNSYRPEMREAVGKIVTPLVESTDVETRIIADSSEGGIVRIQFFFAGARRAADPDDLSEKVLDVVRSWSRRLEDILHRRIGPEKGAAAFRKYCSAFNDAYQVIVAPELAADDIADLDQLGDRPIIRWGRPSQYYKASYLKIFHPTRRLAISELAPTLVDHGFTIDEENSFPIGAARVVHLHIFRLKTSDGTMLIDDARGRAVAESILASFEGIFDHDGLCGLIVAGEISIREIELLRAMRNYARQSGVIPGRKSVNATLLAHPPAARLLLNLFSARFNPDTASDKKYLEARAALDEYLADVPSIDDDRALRAFAHIIDASVRTNYFATPDIRHSIVIKIDCSKVPGMIQPRPWREIWVYGGAIFEGCHLRGGPVARGGIRWSERPDDFRTEILGLMKTQVTKNALIVPTGAKGGFIARKLPAERVERAAHVRDCYRAFISAMLEIQDNVDRRTKRIVKPPRVVRHDGDDSYFVVAADKGTATFSDTANEIAAEFNFWLGDAFASGGSNGYDHKKEGITARGAWVSVERHFRDAGKDIAREPFTVVGVGDMSGDVFGNGMLLSKKIRLLAAFDHRDIFLDPDPDPAKSFAERRRLFRLPRSSWQDYDRAAISRGGGVFPRTRKSIPISPAVRAALGVEARTLDPDSLIRAILTAPVDLLYNGGIGTYVKASHEINTEVGDSQNDFTRVDATRLRCAVVAEGGNLGFTQSARIEYALGGGRIFTDAMDNSGGVDLSDHEVNLKILIGGTKTSERERRELLRKFKSAIVGDVLRDNYLQTLAVSLDEIRSRRRLSPFATTLADLDRRGVLDAKDQTLPDQDTLRDRAATGVGMTKPELSVLVAHAKRDVKARLLDSPIMNRPGMDRFIHTYFPPEVRARFGPAISKHGLRNDLLVTTLTNTIVNFHGATAVHRLTTELGLAASRVVESLLLAREIVDAEALVEDLFALDGRIQSGTFYDELLQLDDCAILTARWLIRNIKDLRGRISNGLPEYLGLADRFLPLLKRILSEESFAWYRSQVAMRVDAGIGEKTAERLALLEYTPSLLDVVNLSTLKKTDVEETGRLLYEIGGRLHLEFLITRLRRLTPTNDWEASAAFDMFTELRRSRRNIAARVIDLGGDLERYLKERFRSFETLQAAIARIETEDPTSIAPFIVIATQVRNLAAL